ncbi:MAG: hypothetical protein BGO45_09045 [Microbacterium sp. 71-36]|uniref:DUF3159 domain-containing protein n=1 Tax=unclassified Microbacterium TaxID=2609290 RepID=UPI000869E183|nr:MULTISPECIES: DUF3159 domain-containing protein [unclassified Microbacterium]MBN9210681.1 DUF3159 domain-containing protein [Microbacterium sp.]ODT37157.1 MAG: hypothetical protein ABS60_13980 [Microbacterium sp. SCN 71-17]OJV76961.1 MAG: hypothetical protein BGO45_09045 [Microbacterium sp. 71-36]
MTEPARPDDGDRVPLEPPSAADSVSAALGSAARRAGLDPAKHASTGAAVWAAMGGWRGILESVLPSLAFVVLFTVTIDPETRQGNLPLSLGVSVGLALVFTIARLMAKSPPSAAIGGLVATAAAALLTLFTGRGQDNFVFGFFTNGAYGAAFLVSVLVGWPLIGLIAGYLLGEGTSWRTDKRRRRVYTWLSLGWAALFVARLIVQLPLYFAGDVTALGTLKIVMGLPLFAPMVAVTWLAVRALSPRRES